MDMGMILERTAPGLEDAEEATPFRADELRVGGQGLDRGAGRLEHRGISDPLVLAHEVAEPGRDGEGEQEVGARQQAIELVLEPGLGLVLLAGGTVPVAAGASHRVGRSAGLTPVDHASQLAGAAGADRSEHFLVLRGHRRAEALEIGRAIPPEHVGDGRHRTTPTSACRWRLALVPGPARSDGDRPSWPARSGARDTAGSGAGSPRLRASAWRSYAVACGS